MHTKDIVFFISLLGSIPFGYVVKQIKSPDWKRLICTVAGVFVVLLLNGLLDFWHSFLTIIGTYCICKSSRSWCNWISFLCVFGYLFFFRSCTYVGLPQPSPYSDNVQLFITLRMIGLAFEIHEATSKNSRKDSSEGDDSSKNADETDSLQNMSFYHFLSYGYCYCGIFTGPYYKYKTYTDMLYHANTKEIPTVYLALKWLTYLPLYIAGYIFFSQWFPAYLGKDQFHNQSILVQIFFLALADIRFRCRIYIGTHMSESSCMTLCLGAYPVETCPKPGQGPTKEIGADKDCHEEKHPESVTSDKKYSFEAIRSMYLKHVEFSSLKMMVRSWNTTVQWWMATYVYKQFPYRQNLVRYIAVAVVSAFWHGLAPGYYLSFVFIPILQYAQEQCARKCKPYLNEQQQVWYHWISWFMGYRLLEYFGVGVWVHSWELTLRCWRSMYYYGHILLVLAIIFTFVMPNAQPEKQSHKKTS